MRKLLATGTAVITVFALAGVASASTPAKKAPVKLSGKVTNKGTGAATNDAAEMEVDDFYFKKTFIKAPKGSTVSVTVKNDGSVQHTFTIDKQNIDETIDPGRSITVDVAIPANGKPVAGYCRFHKSSGMQFAFFSKAGGKAKTTGGDSGGSRGGYGY